MKTAPTDFQNHRSSANDAPFTLCVDVGGTFIKASVLDDKGAMLSERIRLPTPKPAPPALVLDTIEELTSSLPAFDRISLGFPGHVKGRYVQTAPNLGTEHWSGYPLADALVARFRCPARMLNDAIVQGLGVVEGRGLECMITLGTGMGCALFRDGRFLIQLELGRHRARLRLNYDEYVGHAAYVDIGPEKWNRRVRKAIDSVRSLVNCDMLYVGGGNARRVAFDLPPGVKIVADTAGITGGVRLWDADTKDLFESG